MTTVTVAVMSLARASAVFVFLLLMAGSLLSSPVPDAEPDAYSPILPREYEH